jgi:hypothetical protein
MAEKLLQSHILITNKTHSNVKGVADADRYSSAELQLQKKQQQLIRRQFFPKLNRQVDSM